MKISLIHPSRNRPQMAYETAMNWLLRRKHKVEYILVIDEDEPQKAEYYKLFNGLAVNILEVENSRKSCIDAINYGAKRSSGSLLIVVSDDFDCPQHWDVKLLEQLEGKEDFCVKTNDNYQKVIMTLPIMDRKYYDRFGYIYYPGYLHMFCDTEMTAVALMLGRNINVDLNFIHKHYTTGAMIKDDINEKNDGTWDQGQKLFNERVAINFGIKDPVIQFSEIKWN